MAPFLGLFSAVFSSKQTKQASAIGIEVIGPAPRACLVEHPKIWWVRRDSSRRSAESRTCHTRQRLDGDRAAQRQSQTDERIWRLSAEQPGLRDEGRSQLAYLGLPGSTSSPASPATANNEERQKTAQAETNAQGVARKSRLASQIASRMTSKTLAPRKFGPFRWESSCENTSRQPHPAGSRPHNPGGTKCCSGLRRDRAAVSRTALPKPHRGQDDASDPQRRQSGIGFKRVRDIAAPAHLTALIAAKPRIQGVIRHVVWAGFLPEQILEAHLSEVIETATSTHLSAIDSDEQATAKLYAQKAAQAADEARQQTFGGLQGPGVANTTIASLEHPSLKDTLLSQGAWQQVTRIEDLCHAQVSHKWLYHVDACAGSVLTPHDNITNVQKRLGNRVWVGGGQC